MQTAHPSTPTPDSFKAQLAALTAALRGRPLDADLGDWLNREHGPGTATYDGLKAACEAGAAAGWLCDREGGAIRYGRVVKASDELAGFSVDVVDINDIAGPHHRHPNGEIDLVMPQSADARFDGCAAGWVVMPPDSAHRPTVSSGRALVLYLLPNGAIEFTR